MTTSVLTRTRTVLLAGNPNCGKSALFNRLTGMRQKTANYPGVTVDKKSGNMKLGDRETWKVTDLPGTYSIFPTTTDEKIAAREILNAPVESNESVFIYVADVTRLEKQMLLFTQLISLRRPIILCLNMSDLIDSDTE